MTTQNIGILYPGAMGTSVAASAKNSGHSVYWASEGRSSATRERAKPHFSDDLGSLESLCKTCSIIISVCPPHASKDVAEQVIHHGFQGIYLDANAISPQKVEHIAQMMESAGVDFVDGGIIGNPAWQAGQTWLYLSGEKAEEVAHCFSSGPLETKVIGQQIGKASALKMCYAAYTKGTTALLCTILGASEALGVRNVLEEHWNGENPNFANQTAERARGVTAKAWRFSGEMEEIAETFEHVGLPGKFHLGAKEIYDRLHDFKDQDKPSLEQVLESLLHSKN